MRDFGFKIYILLLSTLIVAGCSEDWEDNDTLRTEIVSYLEATHSPVLIAESEVSSSLLAEPAFYTVYGSYAYRYISTYYDADRGTKAEVVSGSTVTITFDLYQFDGDEISTDELPMYSNRAEDQLALSAAGLNTEYWDFSPLTFTIGSSDILSSIQNGLIGCRESDDIEIYMTFNMTYGNTIMGLIEKESAVRFRCTIDKVE